MHPLDERFLEFHVAVGAWIRPACAELFQPLVQISAKTAEFRVIHVAQRAHAESKLRQSGSSVVLQELPESFGVVGRVAITVGAGDDQYGTFAAELRHRIVGEVVNAGCKSALAG